MVLVDSLPHHHSVEKKVFALVHRFLGNRRASDHFSSNHFVIMKRKLWEKRRNDNYYCWLLSSIKSTKVAVCNIAITLSATINNIPSVRSIRSNISYFLPSSLSFISTFYDRKRTVNNAQRMKVGHSIPFRVPFLAWPRFEQQQKSLPSHRLEPVSDPLQRFFQNDIFN